MFDKDTEPWGPKHEKHWFGGRRPPLSQRLLRGWRSFWDKSSKSTVVKIRSYPVCVYGRRAVDRLWAIPASLTCRPRCRSRKERAVYWAEKIARGEFLGDEKQAPPSCTTHLCAMNKPRQRDDAHAHARHRIRRHHTRVR